MDCIVNAILKETVAKTVILVLDSELSGIPIHALRFLGDYLVQHNIHLVQLPALEELRGGTSCVALRLESLTHPKFCRMRNWKPSLR